MDTEKTTRDRIGLIFLIVMYATLFASMFGWAFPGGEFPTWVFTVGFIVSLIFTIVFYGVPWLRRRQSSSERR